MKERWLPIPGYEGAYEVSDLGRVRSLDRVLTRSDGRPRTCVGRVRALHLDGKGYLMVSLCLAGRSERRRVHVLVAEAFLGPRPQGFEVLHRDDDKSNVRLNNIRYGTPAENMEDKKKNGRTLRGRKCHFAKLDVEQVREVRRLSRRMSQRRIADLFSITQQSISDIVCKRSWHHVT